MRSQALFPNTIFQLDEVYQVEIWAVSFGLGFFRGLHNIISESYHKGMKKDTNRKFLAALELGIVYMKDFPE